MSQHVTNRRLAKFRKGGATIERKQPPAPSPEPAAVDVSGMEAALAELNAKFDNLPRMLMNAMEQMPTPQVNVPPAKVNIPKMPKPAKPVLKVVLGEVKRDKNGDFAKDTELIFIR